MAPHFTLLCVAQSGRLEFEALLLAASLRETTAPEAVRLVVAEPLPGPLWPETPTEAGVIGPQISEPVREGLIALGAEIRPFEAQHFGQTYPQGNKIEALATLEADEPFVFLDSDTLILRDLAEVPFDFERPSASLRVEGTWPTPDLYGPDREAIWASLYNRFGLDFEASQDKSQPEGHWRRFLYFNAGFFAYRCPLSFGARFLEIAMAIRDDPPPALLGQSLDPWLDQVALPLAIQDLGGSRAGPSPAFIDGSHTLHYRALPLLYATAPDAVVDYVEALVARNKLKKLLKPHEPFKRMFYQGRGARARALFDRDDLPSQEKPVRQRLKNAGLWMR